MNGKSRNPNQNINNTTEWEGWRQGMEGKKLCRLNNKQQVESMRKKNEREDDDDIDDGTDEQIVKIS